MVNTSSMTKVKINELSFYPGNARRGDIDLIAESLGRLGQYKPVVVNKGTHAPDLANTILAGNHTVMAAQRLGWDKIDAHWVDVDEDTARRIVLVDNAANDKATYDVEALVDLATELPDLEGTGFTRDELDTMLEALHDQFEDLGDDEAGGDATPEGYGLIVDCGDAKRRDTLKARLLSEGYDVGDA